jgi:hypothetical protein
LKKWLMMRRSLERLAAAPVALDRRTMPRFAAAE